YNVSIANLLKLDTERRELLGKIENLRAERNQIAESLKAGNPSKEQIDRGREVKEQITQAEALIEPIESSFDTVMRSIPNVHFDDVPVGGEEDSVEVKTYGEQTTGAKDHLDFATARDWVDFERGTKVAGTKFYYLKGDLALLENAITQYALDL